MWAARSRSEQHPNRAPDAELEGPEAHLVDDLHADSSQARDVRRSQQLLANPPAHSLDEGNLHGKEEEEEEESWEK